MTSTKERTSSENLTSSFRVVIIPRLFQVVELENFLLPGEGDKKLKICPQVFSSSTQLRNRSLRVGCWTIALLASIISTFESFDLAALYVCVALTKSCTRWNDGTLLLSVLKFKIGKVCPYMRAYQLTVCLNTKLLN